MASNGSSTATLSNSSKDLLSSSQLLGSSISSTSSRHASSQISKIYRQASTLFLTRRLPEALSTIIPVITPPTSEENDGSDNQQAPVATASRSTRIKVWSLYLTVLNAILELDPDEGKEAFGSQEWRNLVTKVRDGQVWEEVVKNGYGGREGDVDPDVVINLSTILLTHSRTQILNQQRLENYLASSNNPSLDISARLSTLDSPRSPSKNKSRGTDTPRDLTTRIRILELFTLHVLRQNNEWEYAHTFISSSPDLDDERREAFLLALQQIHDEDLAVERSNVEEQRRKEEQLQRDMEEARRRRIENEEWEKEKERRDRERRQENESERDYGVESSAKANGHIRSKSSKSSIVPPSRPAASPSSSSTTYHSKSKAKSKAITPRPTYSQKALTLLLNLRRVLTNISSSLATNPMVLLRTLAFIVGVLTVLGRRDIREKVRRVVGRGWGRVVETAGMGVKVSYL